MLMKGPTPFLLAFLVTVFLAPANAQADGMFVVPRFVWDKHKDINEPTQKAILVYDAGREDMILQVKYAGPAREFGWLVPVPNLPSVGKGSMKCFYELSLITQQQFDPVQWVPARRHWGLSWGLNSADAATLVPQPPPVKVIETKTAGAYKIAVLSAKDSGALKQWLADNHFYFPPDKAGIMDSYVQRHWYFVAVKIRLGGRLWGFISTSPRLAAGELNPLQVSFASDHCVFPLKISSMNGKPSEVQLYVLSQQPLLEESMLKLSRNYSNAVAQAEAEEQTWLADRIGFPFPQSGDSVHYMRVGGTDLPDCSQWVPRLANKPWWLLKQTWTFKPEEMHDLEFNPSLQVLADMLTSTNIGGQASALQMLQSRRQP